MLKKINFRNLFSPRKKNVKAEKELTKEEWLKIAIEEKTKIKGSIQEALDSFSKIKEYPGVYDVWIFPNREVSCILRGIPKPEDNFSMYQLGNNGKLFCSFSPHRVIGYNQKEFDLWFEKILERFIDRLQF